MGKKANHQRQPRKGRGQRQVRELDAKKVTTTVNLHRRLYKCTFKKKAPTAVKQIKEHARKTMNTRDVRVDHGLNAHLWRNGVRNLDRRVDIVMERRKNEDEDAQEKFYTLVKLA